LNLSHLIAIANGSDGIVYLMAVLLALALTVIIERSWYLRTAIRRGETISRAVLAMPDLAPQALAKLAAASRHSPHAAVIRAALQYPDLRDPVRLAEVLEEAILWQAPEIDRRLWALDTIITLAPLLGLLGTIIGMFNTFQVLGSDAGAPQAITGGVGEALVATACGLLIAIIGLVFFNILNSSVRLVVHQMETLKIMLVNRLAMPHTRSDDVPEVRPCEQGPVRIRA
jgi:biopolymer transport protein ExbB